MKKPKIELKNLKHAEFASEETYCYSASLYVDGKKFATVSNDGRGGCDDVHPVKGKTWEDLRELEKAIKETYPSMVYSGVTLEPDLETVCSELVTRFLQKKDFKKTLKRITYTKPGEKGIFQLPAKYKPTAEHIAGVKKVNEWFQKVTVLNELPEEEAFELYLANG
jgi:hypothetical protein